MDAAIVVGVVATVVALLGMLGRTADSRAWPSQVIVLAFPLAIIAGAYTSSVGMNLVWAAVAVVAVLLAVLAGAVLGRPPAMDDQSSRPAAAGLSLVFSGLIALGLAVIVIVWAAHLIDSFSQLESIVVKVVLVLAAVAFAIGGRAVVGLSRLVMILVIVGALVVLALGVAAGDIGGLTSPQVPVPSPSPLNAILFAVAVVLIGAGFPVLRLAAHNNRRSGVVAAVVLALVLAVFLIGMMALYGGAFQLPSLVINIFPVFAPAWVGAIVCGFVAIVSTVTAGTCIRAAGSIAASIVPSWGSVVEPGGPRRRVALVMGLAVVLVALLNPPPTAIVAILAVLGVANIVAERVLGRGAASGETDEDGAVPDAPRDDSTDTASATAG